MKKNIHWLVFIIIFTFIIFMAYIKLDQGEKMEALKENEYLIYETGIIRVNNFKLGMSGINVHFPFSSTCTLYPYIIENGKLDQRYQTVSVKKGDIEQFENFQVEIIEINVLKNYVVVKIIEN